MLARRGCLLLGRFFSAWANLGMGNALGLYANVVFRRTRGSLVVPGWGRKFGYRGAADYLALTLLFEPNFDLIPTEGHLGTILDLGANIGVETLRFAVLHPTARILAVEADPENYRVLAENFEGCANVDTLNAAAWSEPARFSIRRNPQSAMSSAVELDPNGPVPGVTIGALIDRLEVGEVDVLKIDVEGAEDALFGPSIDSWIGRVRVIVWELNDHEAPDALSRLVRAMGRAGRSFNFTICGEKLVGVRSDTPIRVGSRCGLVFAR